MCCGRRGILGVGGVYLEWVAMGGISVWLVCGGRSLSSASRCGRDFTYGWVGFTRGLKMDEQSVGGLWLVDFTQGGLVGLVG